MRASGLTSGRIASKRWSAHRWVWGWLMSALQQLLLLGSMLLSNALCPSMSVSSTIFQSTRWRQRHERLTGMKLI